MKFHEGVRYGYIIAQTTQARLRRRSNFCEISFAPSLVALTIAILFRTASQPAPALRRKFGRTYDGYAHQGSMIVPNPWIFTTEPMAAFSVATLWVNLANAMVFPALVSLALLTLAVPCTFAHIGFLLRYPGRQGGLPAFQVALTGLDGPLLLAQDRDHGLLFDANGIYPPTAQLWG